MDPKQIVADGYDLIAETFLAWAARGNGEVRDRYLAALAEDLPDGASVLDLGCGAGVPVARRLAERFRVTGVDISRRQIELARANVPSARFIHGDMTAQAFPEASFDAVVALFSIVHLPREQHGPLFRQIGAWLRPGGVLLASLGRGSNPGLFEEWLGTSTFFSGHPAEASRALLEAGGLEIVSAREEAIDEDGRPVSFLWVVARKPAAPESLWRQDAAARMRR